MPVPLEGENRALYRGTDAHAPVRMKEQTCRAVGADQKREEAVHEGYL